MTDLRRFTDEEEAFWSNFRLVRRRVRRLDRAERARFYADVRMGPLFIGFVTAAKAIADATTDQLH